MKSPGYNITARNCYGMPRLGGVTTPFITTVFCNGSPLIGSVRGLSKQYHAETVVEITDREQRVHEVVENIEFLRIKRCREACERNQGLRFLLEETVFRPNTILKLAARTFGSARHGKPASIATPNKLFVIVLLVTVA